MAFDLGDYVTVAERIEEFFAKYPEGSLQAEWEWMTVTVAFKREDGTWVDIEKKVGIVATAYAYRHPDDKRPGKGHAQEGYPGTTPYTKGSELMNAETSAFGRAIVAVGAASTKKGVASRDEVQSRR